MSLSEPITRRERLVSSFPEETRMLVGGEWRAASDGATVDVIDPSTELLLTRACLLPRIHRCLCDVD